MASRQALEAVRDFAGRLRDHFGTRVAWVRLYGSQARGDATAASDVDVFAVVAGLTWHEKGAAIDLGYDVSLARQVHISPVVMADTDFDRLVGLESAFVLNVLSEGIAA